MAYKIRRIMLSITLNLFLLSFFSGCIRGEVPGEKVSSDKTGFYLIDEYLTIHPDQKEYYDSFRAIVQSEARPLGKGLQKSPVSIAMIYPGTEKSDYWRRSVSSFTARLDELNIEYVLSDYFSRPGNIDKKKQEEQIRDALNGDPDYLVFTLDVSRHREIIERIITVGRPKLILQNITTPLKEWEGNQPFLYVGFSHKQGTESILVPEFLDRTEGAGSYAMLYFARGFVSEQRGDTFIDYMNRNSDLTLKAAYYTDGQFDKARDATEEIIRDFPDIDFIYACSTSVALGAIEVLEKRGIKDRILVNGWGGGSAELDSIGKGSMDFTVMRINDDNGIAMAEAVRLDLLGDGKSVPTVYSGDFVLVTDKTTPVELDILKRRAFRYSGINE